MTFDDIKEMQIDSKKVKEAWLNGRQVYPSEKRIMDSLVCWYDIGKQQCTNESMAANPVLADLSGNGHDIECFNFGWAGMSGIGGTEAPFVSSNIVCDSCISQNGGLRILLNGLYKGNYVTFGSGAISSNTLINPVQITVSNLPNIESFDIVWEYRVLTSDGSWVSSHVIITDNGVYNMDLSELNLEGRGIEKVEPYRFYCSTIQDNVNFNNFTIEQLPLYPNALVSDGVDDCAYVEGLPLLNKEDGYTVIAKRKFTENVIGNNCLGVKGVSVNGGAFLLEYKEANSLYCNSFGATNTVVFTDNDITVQRKDYYNNLKLNVGNNIDDDKLFIFSLRNSRCFSKIALYSFLLFDRTLTTAEIEWVKKNMIESNDDDAEWYGVEFYTTSPNPDCIRIGNPELHKTLPVHNQMKGCLLADDGTVNKYLNETDWTSETKDGSQGQVMVEMPKQSYWKFETDGNIRRVKFSTKPLPGFKKTPQGYVSAYEASVQRSTNKLASVVNTTADYRGGNNNMGWDGTYRSLLGMPATQISRTSFRDYARNRKADSTEWNCMTYDFQKLLYWLFVVEYATLNTQKAFNEALTADGYHQGGLGLGVTEINYTKWGDFNGRYPFIPCGHSDSLGNKTGVVDYTMPTEYDAASVKICKVPRYRGIENLFGHIWQWTEGINVRISPNTEDGGDGLSKVFVCSDPSQFSDTGYEGYQYVGDEARTEAYVKEVIFGEGGEIMPLVVGGSSTTFFPDFHHTNIPKAETLRGVSFGGLASNGVQAGFVCAYSIYIPSSSNTYIGSRLCFIPNNND